MLNFTLSSPAVCALAGLVPLVVGLVWYNPMILGRAWAEAAGVSVADLKGMRLLLVIVVTFAGGYYMSQILRSIVIHQTGLFSMLAGEPAMKDTTSPLSVTVHELMHAYGGNFRTFRHGALHGVWTGIKFALPIVAIHGLIEGKGIKYIAINAAFWILNLTLMGAIICHFAELGHH